MLSLLIGCGPGVVASPPTHVSALLSETMPTVVHITWTTASPEVGQVAFETDGLLTRTTPLEAVASTEHAATLSGLPQDTAVTWQIFSEGGTSDVSEIRTGVLDGAPVLTVQGSGQDHFVATPMVTGDAAALALIDPMGRLSWYFDDPQGLGVFRVRIANDGSGIIYSSAIEAGLAVSSSGFVRVSWDGDATFTPVPLLTHDFVELDDGTLVALADDTRDGVSGNKLVSVALDGTLSDLWSTFDCFDPVTNPGDDPEHGWTHANALDYDHSEDQFLVGLRNLGTLVAVSRSTGDCPFAVGGSGGNVEVNGGTFLHQHQFERVGDRLLVFDNDGAPGNTSRVLEYDFDETALTANVVREIVADPPLYSFILGDVFRFSDGDTLVTWSVPGTIDRIDAAGSRTWRVEAPDNTVFGFSTVVREPTGGHL